MLVSSLAVELLASCSEGSAVSPQLAYRDVAELVAKPLRWDYFWRYWRSEDCRREDVGGVAGATVEKGLDPREMVLVAFGGAGPMLPGRLLNS